MNAPNPRYPYPLTRTLIDPRYPSRALEPYAPSRYAPSPRPRGYASCACGTAFTPLGNHLCRSCILTTHAANQVLNVRGGDHCDCPACDLADLDDVRGEVGEDVMVDGRGYHAGGSDICRSCGRRNCPLDCRNRAPVLSPPQARQYAGQYAFVRREARPPMIAAQPYRWR